jgi:PEP-CTERM motif
LIKAEICTASFNGGSVSKVTPSGIVSTFATGFNTPVGLAFDHKGDLFVSDANAHSITEITPDGVRSTLYSISAINGDLPDGNIFDPRGMAFDKNGDLFVSVFSDLVLFQFDEDGGFRRFAISTTADWIAFGPSAVPEPSTWAVMLIGFCGLGFAFRRSDARCRSPKPRTAFRPSAFPASQTVHSGCTAISQPLALCSHVTLAS